MLALIFTTNTNIHLPRSAQRRKTQRAAYASRPPFQSASPNPRGVCTVTGPSADPSSVHLPATRGLHSFTFQINVSAFCGIGGIYRVCLRGAQGVQGGV